MTLSPSSVEQICRLSPAQGGMLLEMLGAGAPGLHYEQAFCALPAAAASASRLREAWEWLVARHASLRTSFRWHGLSSPVQIVHAHASPGLCELDWRNLEPDAVEPALRAFLSREQERGVDLQRPPLLKLTLIHVREGAWFVLGMHHLIHDAWSIDILLDELSSYLEGTTDLPQAPPYADYVRFMQQADLTASAGYWRRYLAGWDGLSSHLTGAHLPGPDHADRADASHGRCLIESSHVDADRAGALLAGLRQRNLGLHSAALAAWAVLLSAETGRREVTFGGVVAGRPLQLAGVERIVGLFINVVPRRVEVPAEQRIAAWLEALQRDDVNGRPFELLPASRISRTASAAAGVQPFGSVVVLNAFRADGVAARGLGASHIGSFGRSNVPVTFRITPGSVIRLELLSPGLLAPPRLRSLLRRASSLLSSLPDLWDERVQVLMNMAMRDDSHSMPAKTSGAWRAVRATPLNRDPAEVVDVSVPTGALRYPAVLTAWRGGTDLNVWAVANRQWLDEQVRDHGCVLLRGFRPLSAAEFGQLIKALHPELLEYKDRSTPRTALGGHIYTSTEYPPHQSIALHNEFSYATSWPRRIAFCCLQPAETGGETPLADVSLVYDAIPADIRDRFERHGVMYVRNYGVGVDLTWQEAFQTEDRAEVDAYCAAHEIEAEWIDGNRLRTRQVRQACAVHPHHETRLWFNQAHLFHLSNLAVDVRAAMTRMFESGELPRDARLGDGSAIPDEDMDKVREAYRHATVTFLWELGDVLLVDNMRIAHGRNPFTGSRRVIVGMSEPHASTQARPEFTSRASR